MTPVALIMPYKNIHSEMILDVGISEKRLQLQAKTRKSATPSDFGTGSNGLCSHFFLSLNSTDQLALLLARRPKRRGQAYIPATPTKGKGGGGGGMVVPATCRCPMKGRVAVTVRQLT